MTTAAAVTIGDRLRECARRVGTIDRLAKLAGIPRRSLEDYIHGLAEMKASRLFSVANAARVSPIWLQTGEEAPDTAGTQSNDFVAIAPLLHDNSSNRDREPHHALTKPLILFHRDLVPQSIVDRAPSLRALCMPDDTMADTIRVNDILLINTAERAVQSDGIFAFRLNGRIEVKRLQRRPGLVLHVQNDNRRYDSFDLPHGSGVELMGRVVWSGGAL